MEITDERLAAILAEIERWEGACPISHPTFNALAADLRDARTSNARLREACRASQAALEKLWPSHEEGLLMQEAVNVQAQLRAALEENTDASN